MWMDWNGAVEENREALKRILATLVAMAGLDDWRISPLEGEMSAQPTEGGDGPPRETPPSALPGISPSRGEIAPTLPRHLYRTILRLLRPAESAVRRLIIVAARGLVVDPPRPRPPRPDPLAGHAVLRSLGLAVVVSPAEAALIAAAARRAAARRPQSLNLPLLDPLRLPRYRRRPTPTSIPRIMCPGFLAPPPLPTPPTRYDPMDATRLVQRLATLSRVLDDLPAQALRFARWRAARDAEDRRARDAIQHGRPVGRLRRSRPLRPGLPPGQTLASHRRPRHEIHELVKNLQSLACWALERTDTS